MNKYTEASTYCGSNDTNTIITIGLIQILNVGFIELVSVGIYYIVYIHTLSSLVWLYLPHQEKNVPMLCHELPAVGH